MIPEHTACFQAQLAPLFARLPVGVVNIATTGTIGQINPRAVQLIMPLAMQRGFSGLNLLEILSVDWPELYTLIEAFKSPSGMLLEHHPVRLHVANHPEGETRYFVFTVEKLAENRLLIFFDDLTVYLHKANLLAA